MPILRVIARALAPVILLFGLYVQFHGDFGPGGGFQAGVIFAAGLIIFALTFGVEALRQVVPVVLTERLMAAGVLLYGAVGVLAMFLGGEFLNYSALDPLTTGHYGQHLGIIVIELGVGIAVAATIMRVYYGFVGRRPDEDETDAALDTGAGGEAS
jgi:multicomponent Na+:H+ antiporter subunit B